MSFREVIPLTANDSLHVTPRDIIAYTDLVCKYCGAILKSRSGLNDHERRHAGAGPYKCCGKTYFSRKFSYCMSKRAVYDVVDETSDKCPSDETTCRICMNGSDALPGNINTRDHPFDSVTRKRLSGRRKDGTVFTERNSI